MAKWTPQSSEYGETIRSQNPWHYWRMVPKELAPSTYRPLAEYLWIHLLNPNSTRQQIILGPRRVGKTTVMYQTVDQLIRERISPQRLWWLRLDHPLLLDWDLGDMVKQIITFVDAEKEKPVYIFLDELTYADKWDLWLKTFYDEKWPVKIIGTSSATAAIRQSGTESGVGRWDEQYLAPYLFTEFLDLKGKGRLFNCEKSLGLSITSAINNRFDDSSLIALRRQFLLTGGFPELLLEAPRPDEASELLRSQRILRSDAIEKAVYKDIPQAFSIQDPTKLERLLYVLAGQMGGIFSPNTVATDIGVAAPTVERYVGFFERAFLIFSLPNYSVSEETIQRRGKKLYFVDGAVRNAALLRGGAPINDPMEMGMLIENMAASHLRALAYQEDVRLYHWRQKNYEVDFVYDHPDDPVAFEITGSKSHNTRGLEVFQEKFPKFRGKCYLVGEEITPTLPTTNQPGTLPLDLFFVIIGKQEQFALENRIGRYKPTESNGQKLLF